MNDESHDEALEQAKETLTAVDATMRSDYNGIMPGESIDLQNGETVYVVDRSVDRWRTVHLIIETDAGDREKLREGQLIDRMKEAEL
jgi:hypothetical protein